MDFKNILVSSKESISFITIIRPQQLNALNKATIAELSAAFDHLEKSTVCRAIIVTGSGEKAFVAGADIKEFAKFNSEQGKKLSAEGQKILFNKIANFTKPIIAAVNGFALGGG